MASSATPELFAILRVQPAIGRLFSADDVRPGAQPVALIGYDLWQTRFGSDPNILSPIDPGGKHAAARGRCCAAGISFSAGLADAVDHPGDGACRGAGPARKPAGSSASAALRPGQTTASALTEFETLSAQFEQEFPEQNRGSQYYVEPLRDALVGDTKRPLLLLLGAVGFVLLIACANVGNLLLARSLGRQQEMAVRVALGAGWKRLAAQIVTEALVLAVAGGVVGVIVAWRAAPALASLVPESTRIPGLDDGRSQRVGPGVLARRFDRGGAVVQRGLVSQPCPRRPARGPHRDAAHDDGRRGAGGRRRGSSSRRSPLPRCC